MLKTEEEASGGEEEIEDAVERINGRSPTLRWEQKASLRTYVEDQQEEQEQPLIQGGKQRCRDRKSQNSKQKQLKGRTD